MASESAACLMFLCFSSLGEATPNIGGGIRLGLKELKDEKKKT